MHSLQIPTLPNSPLQTKTEQQPQGNLKLQFNAALNFVENAAFDGALAHYDDNYQNSQAYSKHFQSHMEHVLRILKSHFKKNSLIVEVGCGKGDFIELIQTDAYFQAVGYDASYGGENPHIQKRYLTSSDKIRGDLIVIRHVLEHIQAPHFFLNMLKDVFGSAKIYIEVPNYDWIIANQAFFDITYEHVNYFSQNALMAFFDRPPIAAGLCFNDQYQYVLADLDTLGSKFADAYDNGEWLEINFDELFPTLSEKISAISNQLSNDSKAYIWGAATKGCMFLVHCANQHKLLEKIGFAIDANPNKIGKYLPGTLVPIKGKEAFFSQVKAGDLLIISNPNYQSEIMEELNSNGLGDLNVVCL